MKKKLIVQIVIGLLLAFGVFKYFQAQPSKDRHQEESGHPGAPVLLSPEISQAIDEIKNHLKKNPSDFDMRFRLGKLYYDNQNHRDAIKELLGVLDIQPRHFKTLAFLGSIYHRAGDDNQAEWFWRSALDADPDNEIILSLLNSISSSKQKVEPEWMKRYLKGDKLAREGKREEALSEVKKAISLNPFDSRSYFLMGTIYRDLDDTDAMIKAWEKAKELNPSDFMFSELLTYAKKKKGVDDKRKELEKRLQESPNDDKTKRHLIQVYLDSDRAKYYDLSIQYALELIQKTPKDFELYLFLATAWEKKEDMSQAAPFYQKYIDSGGKEPFVKGRLNTIKRYEEVAARQSKNLKEDMALIRAGNFKRGAPYVQGGGGIDEGPEADIFLPDFYIDRYEVTHRQYKKFVDEAGYKPPVYWKKRDFPEGKGLFPVVYVSWYDASSYCDWAGKRLPTENEWEKAARGTDGRRYPWGNNFDSKYANTVQAKFRIATPVGSYPEGVSSYGVYDMAGNVQEWIADWYKPYPGSDLKRKAFGEKYKGVRGGSFLAAPQENARTTARNAKLPTKIHRSIGFRCAKGG